MTTCAIYIRKSREDKDRQSHRLTVQREQLPAHALAQGWTPLIYDDGHASAAKGKADDLRERGRLEADIRSGKINVILCIELSRLSRDETLADYLAWLNLCAAHKVKLATMGRILDPSQTSDWMLLLMEGGFSSVEMKILQSRMAEGRQQAHSAGKWLGGVPPAPYVYDKQAGRPVVDPAQLAEMQTIWTLAETHSVHSIAGQLNRPEIFIRRAIADDRLLMCQALRRDPESLDLIPCDWQPVIDADQAERIRAGRRTRKNVPGVRRKAAALLSNLSLLRCGFCGHSVKTWANSKIRKDGSRYDYYGCKTKNSSGDCPQSRLIFQAELNDKVLTNIFRTLAKVDDLKRAWTLSQQQGDLPAQLKQLEREERDANTQKSRLIEAVAEGLLTAADIKDKRNKIDTTLDSIHSQRKALLGQIATPPDWDSLTLTRDDFDLLEEEEQREFLRAVLGRITIFSGHAILTYTFPRHLNGDPTARINFDPPVRRHHKSLPASFSDKPLKNAEKNESRDRYQTRTMKK